MEPTKYLVAATKRDTVTNQYPEDADNPYAEEILHEHAQDILRAHHSAVEERQAGRHQEHKGRGGQNPGGAADTRRAGYPVLELFKLIWVHVSPVDRSARLRGPREPRFAAMSAVPDPSAEGSIGSVANW